MCKNLVHRVYTIIQGLLLVSSVVFGTAHGIAQDFGRRYGASSRLLQRPLYFRAHRANITQPQHCVRITQYPQVCHDTCTTLGR